MERSERDRAGESSDKPVVQRDIGRAHESHVGVGEIALGEAQGSTHAAQVHTLGSAQLDDAIRERLMVHHPSNALVHNAFWSDLVEILRDELEVILEKIDPSGRWFRKLVLGEDLGHCASRSGQLLAFVDKKWPVKIEYLFDET